MSRRLYELLSHHFHNYHKIIILIKCTLYYYNVYVWVLFNHSLNNHISTHYPYLPISVYYYCCKSYWDNDIVMTFYKQKMHNAEEDILI